MRTEKNILIAFILNLAFSIFEFVGGLYTGSVAIISDAIHDIGDALSICIAYFLEKLSKKQPDDKYTYGYARYSVIGSIITTGILIFGSAAVIYNAIGRLVSPTDINYNGMIVFAVIGTLVNLCAAFFTHSGDSLNQKAVNLHMIEDVLGWIVVLVGAFVMKLTDFAIIDPIMSIGVAVFIFVNAVRNLNVCVSLFLEKTPCDIDINQIKNHIKEIEGVLDAHHIHVWSMDGHNNYATMHIVTDGDYHTVKEMVREELREHGITHATLELESCDEHCHSKECVVEANSASCHHHHHHHHHH